MTTSTRPEDRDEILITFIQTCPKPSAAQIMEWCERYPDLADDIRYHAAISRDWAAQEGREERSIDKNVLDRGFSRVLNLIFEAERDSLAISKSQSFREVAEQRGLDVPTLATKLDIDRSVLSALFNGRMLAPIGTRFMVGLTRALELPEQAFHALHQASLMKPHLGHAKSSGTPTVKPLPYRIIVEDSQMTADRKRYWLDEG